MAKKTDELELILRVKDLAKRTLGKLQDQIVGIGAAYLTWKAAKNIIGGIIKEGMAAEVVWNDVKASLDRHGYAVEENLKKVSRFATELQNLTGISDEVTGTAVQMLIDYNNNLATSFDLVKVAADLAAGGHMDMRAAVDLVGKASVGYTGTLSRYGIILDESLPKQKKFEEAIKQINQRFGGAAAARMETTAGKIELLNQRFGDLQETLYNLSVSGGIVDGTTLALDRMLKVLIDGIDAIGGVDGAFQRLATRLSAPEFADAIIKAREEFDDLFKLMSAHKPAGEPVAAYSVQLTDLLGVLENEQLALDTSKQAWIDYAAAIMSGKMAASALAGAKIDVEYDEVSFANNLEDRVNRTAEADAVIAANAIKSRMDTAKKVLDIDIKGINQMLDAMDKGVKKISFMQITMAESYLMAMNNAAFRAADSLVMAMSGVRMQFADIFRQMYQDFLREFLQRAIMKLATNVLGGIPIIGSVFGKAAVSSSVPDVSLRPTIQYNYDFNGPVTDVQYVQKYIAPVIENASKRNASTIQMKPQFMTGRVI